MTRLKPNRWFPHLLVSDTVAIIIVAGLIAALLIIAALAPDIPSLKPGKSESGELFRLSPIPPGAR